MEQERPEGTAEKCRCGSETPSPVDSSFYFRRMYSMRMQRKSNSRKQSHKGQQGTVYVTITMGPSEALTRGPQEMGEPTLVGLTILSGSLLFSACTVFSTE